MLNFPEFFTICEGFWTTERTYHYTAPPEIERSYTEFMVKALPAAVKQAILGVSDSTKGTSNLAIDYAQLAGHEPNCPGFDITFDTVSETGKRVGMSLKALFVPDVYLAVPLPADQPLPLAAQVDQSANSNLIQGLYFRDEGYSEGGAIAGQFTYQPLRQTLEMTTHYRQSVAVDQIRLVTPETRLRTIVTYDRPLDGTVPSVITLIGFGVEHKKLV